MPSENPALRSHADIIIKAALDAVDPGNAVKKHLSIKGKVLRCATHTFDLSDYRKIFVIGAGKAAAPMAAAVEDIFKDLLSGGIVVVKDGHVCPVKKTTILEASHPVPDERSVKAANAIMELVEKNADDTTLFINLISGGASALLSAPAPGITLDDKQTVNRLLLECGAEIQEINAVRKHLSAVKGGNLARLAGSSTMLSLVISDVIHDRLDTIGSGPAFPDRTTWQDARNILEKYDLWDRVPESVQKRIEQGIAGKIPDTPCENDPSFMGVTTCVIASNRQALMAAAAEARRAGYDTLVLSSSISGETIHIAKMHAAIAREITETGNPAPPPCCIISGGETTVTMGEKHGTGGRNQEFALAAACEISGLENLLILSVGTDGTDGPTDAAGAMVTGDTLRKARGKGLDALKYLETHDAYTFFRALDQLVITGPTMTNVMDIHVILAGA